MSAVDTCSLPNKPSDAHLQAALAAVHNQHAPPSSRPLLIPPLLQLPLRRRAVFVVAGSSAASNQGSQAADSREQQRVNEPPSPGSNEVADSPRPAPDEPSSTGAPADSAELVSPFDALARGSPSAASVASRSSGAGSAADAALLSSQQQPQQGTTARSRLRVVLQRVWRGFVRFVLWPLFGYDPSRIQGEWLPSDAYSARWAVVCAG